MANRQDFLKKAEAKNQLKQQAGLISERYPKVSEIVINITYYRESEDTIYMKRTVNYFPTSHALFNMECVVRECEKGGFDFNRLIARQIKEHKKLFRGEMSCKGKNGTLTPDHSKISYDINIKYRRNS